MTVFAIWLHLKASFLLSLCPLRDAVLSCLHWVREVARFLADCNPPNNTSRISFSCNRRPKRRKRVLPDRSKSPFRQDPRTPNSFGHQQRKRCAFAYKHALCDIIAARKNPRRRILHVFKSVRFHKLQKEFLRNVVGACVGKFFVNMQFYSRIIKIEQRFECLVVALALF